MSQSAVSRQVSALEQELGTPLFHRHARGLILTEEGELLMRAARDIIAEAGERARAARRFARPADRHAARHHHRRPRLDLAHLAHQRVHRPLSGHPPRAHPRRHASSTSPCGRPTWRSGCARRRSPTSIQRKLFTVHFHVYASPAYIKRFGQPQTHRRHRQPPHRRLRRERADLPEGHELALHGRARAGRAALRRRSRSTTSWRSAARSRRASASPCCRTISSARIPSS